MGVCALGGPVPGKAVILKSHPTHRKWGGWGQVRRSSSDYMKVRIEKVGKKLNTKKDFKWFGLGDNRYDEEEEEEKGKVKEEMKEIM